MCAEPASQCHGLGFTMEAFWLADKARPFRIESALSDVVADGLLQELGCENMALAVLATGRSGNLSFSSWSFSILFHRLQYTLAISVYHWHVGVTRRIILCISLHFHSFRPDGVESLLAQAARTCCAPPKLWRRQVCAENAWKCWRQRAYQFISHQFLQFKSGIEWQCGVFRTFCSCMGRANCAMSIMSDICPLL